MNSLWFTCIEVFDEKTNIIPEDSVSLAMISLVASETVTEDPP